MESLAPKRLVSHKVYVGDPEAPTVQEPYTKRTVHMLTTHARHGFSVMVDDLKSLIRLGLVRMQSNEPGTIAFYFEE